MVPQPPEHTEFNIKHEKQEIQTKMIHTHGHSERVKEKAIVYYCNIVTISSEQSYYE